MISDAVRCGDLLFLSGRAAGRPGDARRCVGGDFDEQAQIVLARHRCGARRGRVGLRITCCASSASSPTRATSPTWNQVWAQRFRAAAARAHDGRRRLRGAGHPDRAPGDRRGRRGRRHERQGRRRRRRRRRPLLRLLPAQAGESTSRSSSSNRVGSGASFANGGWLCPAQAGPLPEPGLTLYGMRALFDRDSALYFKPGDWNRLAPWLLRFWTYCNERDHAHGTAAIARLGHDVFDLSRRCAPTASSSSCTSRAWSTPPAAPTDARAELAKLAPMREFGYELPDDVITDGELHELEPALLRRGDRRVPDRPALARRAPTRSRPASPPSLRRDGVEIQEGAEVFELVREGRRLTHVRTAAGDIEADTVVLAAGAWTTPARALDRHLASRWRPARATASRSSPTVVPAHAILLVDVHVGCTPFGDRMRIGGTMEFSGINNRLDRRRIDSIVAGARRVVPAVADARDRVGVGRHAADHRRRPADPRPRRRPRQRLHRDRLRDAGRDARADVRPGAGRDDRDRPAPARCSSRSGSTASAACRSPTRPAASASRRGHEPDATHASGSRSSAPGNIGTDLMIKVERSPLLELVGMAGIDPESDGLRRRASAATPSPHLGLADLLELVAEIDLAFDATSAGAHAEHARLLAARGIRSVDLTPAALGPAVVPPVNLSRARRRARGQPDHLRRAGDDPDRGRRSAAVAAAALRRDRLDGLVALGRTGHAAEHRRVHRRDRARPGDDRRRAARPRRSSS